MHATISAVPLLNFEPQFNFLLIDFIFLYFYGYHHPFSAVMQVQDDDDDTSEH